MVNKKLNKIYEGMLLGVGFVLVIGVLFVSYAFVEPAQSPSAGSYYTDSNSQILKQLSIINSTLTNLSKKGTFAGYSSSTYSGALNSNGTKGGNQICNSNFPGSHWANNEEIMSLGPNYPWTYDVWVRDSIKSTYWTNSAWLYFLAPDGYTWSTSTAGGSASCIGWTYASNSASYFGTILSTTGTYNIVRCDWTYRLACVY